MGSAGGRELGAGVDFPKSFEKTEREPEGKHQVLHGYSEGHVGTTVGETLAQSIDSARFIKFMK